MNFAELEARLNAEFPAQRDGTRTALSTSGAKYEIVTSGGLRQEGEPAAGPHYFESEHGACIAYLDCLRNYVSLRGTGMIEWRVRPEINIQESELDPITLRKKTFIKPRYVVYSRLSIESLN